MQRLTPRTGWQQPTDRWPRIRADQHDIYGASHPPVLERVVQYRDIAPFCRGCRDPRDAIGVGDDRHRRVRNPMHRGFIAIAVATEDETGPLSAIDERGREPRRHRRLAGAAYREVADADRRNGRLECREETPVVQPAAHRRNRAVGRGEWREGRANRPRAWRLAEPDAIDRTPPRGRHRVSVHGQPWGT